MNKYNSFYKEKAIDFLHETSNEYDSILFEKEEETNVKIKNINYHIENKNLTQYEVILKCKTIFSDLLSKSNNPFYVYNTLQSILKSNNKEFLCDSFIDGEICIDTLFTPKTKNIIVLGAGVCGLYTSVNLKLLIPNCNVLVIDNRVLEDGYKKQYSRRWATQILKESIINLSIRKILGIMGNDGFIGCYINMFEMIYFLYARIIKIHFLFKKNYDSILSSLKNIDYIIDATGNRLNKNENIYCKNVFNAKSLGYNDNFIQQHYKMKRTDHKSFILSYYLNDNKIVTTKMNNSKNIFWNILKIINIEYKHLSKASALVEKYNALVKTNKFFIYVTNFIPELNKINIFINLSHKELSLFDNVDMSLDNFVNKGHLVEDSYLYNFFNELNTSNNKIIIEKKFYYRQYYNIQNKRNYFNAPLILIGDSVFCGDPRFNNGLSKHLKILNKCFKSIVNNYV